MRIWDARTGDETAVLAGHEGDVTAASFSPDGTRIISASNDGTVRIWDAYTGAETAVLTGHDGSVYSAAFSPDGALIATAGDDRTVRIRDSLTGTETAVLAGHEGWIGSVAFSPDGTRIASASADGTVRIWDPYSGAETAVLTGHEDGVNSVAYSPDGARVASAGYDSTVRIWDTLTGSEVAILSGHGLWIDSVAYSPDGTRIASAGYDRTVRIWDALTGSEVAILSGHEFSVESVVYSPDGTRIASAGWDETVRIWDALTGEEVDVLSAHRLAVSSAAYSPDGTHIASAGDDGTVRIWDTLTNAETAVLRGHDESVNSVAYSPDGTHIASAGDDGTVRIWDTLASAEAAVLRGHDESVNSVAYSPDGTHIASAGDDGTVRIWDTLANAETAVLRGHDESVNSVAYSPDGTHIASAGDDGTVRIWDMLTNAEAAVLRGHEGVIHSVAYSPDGMRIASAGFDGTVRIWSATTGKETIALRSHGSPGVFLSVAFSPDGAGIASAGNDGTVHVWDASTKTTATVLRGHLSLVNSVVYHPDGTRIVPAGEDGTVRSWLVGEPVPDLVYQGLPGRGWIAYRPDHLRYAASFDAERHVRVRFDGNRCLLYGLLHGGRYCPVYPLDWYQEVLRVEPAALRSYLRQPSPDIRQKELRIAWERADRARVLLIAAAPFVLVVGVLFIIIRVLRGRRNPLAITEEFFVTSNDYQVERRLTSHALLLADKDRTRHYAVLNANGTNDVTAALARRRDRSNSVPLLFLVRPATVSESEREQQAALTQQIKAKHRVDVVPMELAFMERALRRGTVDPTVNDAKDRYVTRQDPYFELSPVTDPNLFFGRKMQLRTIPTLLSQGQHVGIFGLRKTGKSSLAHQIQLRFQEIPLVRISCQELDGYSAPSFLLRVAEELRIELRDRFSIHPRRDSNGDHGTLLRSLIETWKDTGRSEPFVIILDEIDSLVPFGEPTAKHEPVAEGRKILGVLRALAQELHGVVLLAIAYRPDINRTNELPADAGENPLFMGFHEVYTGALSPEECDTMIRELGAWRGINWEQSALLLLYEYCGGHPLVARLFASDACEQGRRKDITVDRVEETASAIRMTMRTHQINSIYKQVVNKLRTDELHLVERIAGSSEPLSECRISRDQEQVLTDLESLGLVVNRGAIKLSAKLFEYWVRTMSLV